MSEQNKGYIYILTNPSFPDYVKIGYADDVPSRVKHLNQTECTPYAFRIYATYDASLVAQLVKDLPAMLETWVQSLGWEDPLGKGKATHSSILAWRIPWTRRVGHD